MWTPLASYIPELHNTPSQGSRRTEMDTINQALLDRSVAEAAQGSAQGLEDTGDSDIAMSECSEFRSFPEVLLSQLIYFFISI